MRDRLALPVAALIRRTRNAKSPKERHDTAYFAWEASIRIAVAAAPPTDTAALALPSIGHWVRALALPDVTLNQPPILAAHALFHEVGQGKESRPRSTTARKLLDLLPAYRNQVVGHGGARTNEFYDAAATTLLAGIEAVLEHDVLFPHDARLVWVDSIEIGVDGSRKARILELAGLASTLVSGPDDATDLLPHRVYVERQGAYRDVHPWLLFQEAELRECVLFFNGRHKSSQYLDYVSGETLKGKALVELYPTVEKDVDALFAGTTRSSSSQLKEKEEKEKDLFGEYKLLGELGKGGMGIVYMARQQSLGRLVALKMLPPALSDDETAVARFKREIRALSRCDHPNVIKILASGEADGRHYYAMELIQGADLSQVARKLGESNDLGVALSTATESLRRKTDDGFAEVPKLAPTIPPHIGGHDRGKQLAALFRDAASGLQHLHEQGIIHRDIKPGNLMVTEADRRIVIMDLGLATVADASRSITHDKSTLLGTLRYMPPEQLQRSWSQIDARADVYSLGVTLYELLTDRPFFDGDTEVRLMEQILRGVPPPAAKVQPSVPRDLSLIVAKATEKEPALRYPTAEAFAQDLENFIAGRPIVARPPTLGYLLQVAIRRNRVLAVVIATALVLGIVGTIAFITKLSSAVDRAEQQAAIAQEQRTRAEQQTAAARSARARAEESRYAADMRMIQHAVDEGNLGAVRDTLARHRPAAGEADQRGFEWRHFLRLLDGDSAATFAGHRGELRGVAFSADGKWLATGGTDAVVRVHDVARREKVKELAIEGIGVMSVAFDSKGKYLAVATGNWSRSAVPGKVFVYALPELALAMTLEGHVRAVNSVAFSPDGDYLATGSEDSTVMVWEVAKGPAGPPRHFQDRSRLGINAIAWLTRRTLVAGAGDGSLQMWSVDQPGAAVFDGVVDASGIMSLAAAPDGATIAVGIRDGSIAIWNSARRSVERTLHTSQGQINGLAFSADGALLASAGSNGAIDLTSTRSWERVRRLKGHQQVVFPVAFSPAGDLLASGSADSTAKLWATEGIAKPAIALEGSGASVTFSPDGKIMAIAQGYTQTRAPIKRGGAVLWDVVRDQQLALLSDAELMAVAFSRDGRLLATGALDGTTTLWDVAKRAKLGELRTRAAADDRAGATLDLTISAVAFSNDGKLLATGGRDHHVRVWDVATKQLVTDREHTGWVRTLAFSPDGRLLASAGSDREVRLWSTSGYAQVAVFRGYGGAINSLAFSFDSHLLATGSNDGIVRLWNLQERALGKLANDVPAFEDAIVLPGHNASILAVGFSPDGRTLAAGSQDSTISLWNTQTLLEVAVLARHQGGVLSVAFSPDGSVLASGSNDRTVVLHRAAKGDELDQPRPPGWSTP